MNIKYWPVGPDTGRAPNAIAVIPTIDASKDPCKSLIDEFTSWGVSCITVEDSFPTFRFSVSMNAGINYALKYLPLTIILSNDDISGIAGLNDMIQFTIHYNKSYAVPYVNNRKPVINVTRNRLSFIFAHTIVDHAPFYALRVLSRFKHKKWALGTPYAGFGHPLFSVQPFAIFPAWVLQKYQFDEHFINGLEDQELSYHLNNNDIHGDTSPDWHVDHQGSHSFRSVRQKQLIGLYLCNDEEMIASAEYFYRKHFEEVKIAIVIESDLRNYGGGEKDIIRAER